MDYKTRFPNAQHWRGPMLETRLSPFPHNEPNEIGLFEIDSPDFSTVFLGFPFYLEEEANDTGFENTFVTNLIESPEGCSMRRKFEHGEITWKEFWHHRGWLIELRHQWHPDREIVRYVHPSQMTSINKLIIDKYNHQSPLLLKLQTLMRSIDYGIRQGMNCDELIKQLAEFREKYPEVVLQNEKILKAA